MKNALRLSLASVLLTFACMSFAAAIDTPDRAIAVQERIQNSIFAIKGVNGLGIGGCDVRTGKEALSANLGHKPFVHCLVINTETKDAYNYLIKRYPVGSKIDGVFVAVRHIGVIRPQPRATAGN